MHFSLYHTAEGLLYKTACQLVEKSYHSNLKIIVLTPGVEEQESLNKIIWTYSRKQFIPHGSKLDPFPEKQPLYLTCEFENPNKATMLIIIAPFNIEEIFSQKDYISHFQRIIIIYESLDNLDMLIRKISELNTSLYSNDPVHMQSHTNAQQFCESNSQEHASIAIIDCYKQTPLGVWSKQESEVRE